jgi:hypothetical protein
LSSIYLWKCHKMSLCKNQQTQMLKRESEKINKHDRYKWKMFRWKARFLNRLQMCISKYFYRKLQGMFIEQYHKSIQQENWFVYPIPKIKHHLALIKWTLKVTRSTPCRSEVLTLHTNITPHRTIIFHPRKQYQVFPTQMIVSLALHLWWL